MLFETHPKTVTSSTMQVQYTIARASHRGFSHTGFLCARSI